MKNYIIIVLVLAVFLGLFFGWKWIKVLTASDYDKMLDALYSQTVPLIKVDAIDRLDDYLVLDTRAQNEYQVSALKNAHFVGYPNPNLELLQEVPKDQAILVYCSVGYRSERVGESIKALGFTNVHNLYGGIFEWVNSNKTLYHEENPVPKVHGYAPSWGKWIKKDIEIVYD